MQLFDLQYFGSIESISTLINQSNNYFSASTRWKKDCLLNRTWVAGSNNLISLSVPLEGGRAVNLPYRDIRIAYAEPWQRVHWRTLHDCYRKAPWFEQFAGSLEMLFQSKVNWLVEWNQMCLYWALRSIGLNSVNMAEIEVVVPEFNLQLVSKKPLLQVPNGYPRYHQVFEDRVGFIGNLSIVDLVFCEGPAAVSYLQKIAVCINNNQNTFLTDEIH